MISSNYNDSIGYLREEGHKVYFRYDAGQNEFLLYDFDLQAGDSVYLPKSDGMYLQVYEPSTVQSVDSIFIGAEYHRRITIESWLIFDFIEGVGSAQGLLYCELPWVDWYGTLSCFSQDDTIFETNGSGASSPGNCWVYIGIPEAAEQTMQIYPNPASDRITLQSDTPYTLQLFNLGGNMLRETYSSTMSLEGLPMGMYILKILGAEENPIAFKKVIKSRN